MNKNKDDLNDLNIAANKIADILIKLNTENKYKEVIFKMTSGESILVKFNEINYADLSTWKEIILEEFVLNIISLHDSFVRSLFNLNENSEIKKMVNIVCDYIETFTLSKEELNQKMLALIDNYENLSRNIISIFLKNKKTVYINPDKIENIIWLEEEFKKIKKSISN